MKKTLYTLILATLLFSCSERPFVPNYEITAQFNEKNLTKTQEDSIIKVLQTRFSAYKLRNEISFIENNISIKLMDLKRNIDAEGIKDLITNQGKIEFWHSFNNTELGDSIFLYSNKLELKTAPLIFYINPNIDSTENWIKNSILGKVKIIDTNLVTKYLNIENFKSSLPENLKFKWSKYPSSATEYGDLLIDLHLVKNTNTNKSLLDNSHIKSIKNTSDLLKKNPMVNLTFTDKGKEIWSEVTQTSATNQTSIIMLLDNKVFSASPVKKKMTEGVMQITDGFLNNDNGGEIAYNLVTLVKSGIIPIPLTIKEFKHE